MLAQDDRIVVVGRVSGVYGVRGWVRVFSETRPRENILHYSPWYLKRSGAWQAYEVTAGRRHGKGIVVQMAGCVDRDGAATLVGAEIGIQRSLLPRLAEGEYYWADLVGLEVVNTEGISLGRVDYLLETGANDVLVVAGERERLIPFVVGPVVTEVDLDGRITVDWDPEF